MSGGSERSRPQAHSPSGTSSMRVGALLVAIGLALPGVCINFATPGGRAGLLDGSRKARGRECAPGVPPEIGGRSRQRVEACAERAYESVQRRRGNDKRWEPADVVDLVSAGSGCARSRLLDQLPDNGPPHGGDVRRASTNGTSADLRVVARRACPRASEKPSPRSLHTEAVATSHRPRPGRVELSQDRATAGPFRAANSGHRRRLPVPCSGWSGRP